MKLKLAAAAVMLPAALLLLNSISHSQNDTPVTVGNGSLFIQSPGLNATWTKTDNETRPTNQNGQIVRVTVAQAPGQPQVVPCGSQTAQCMIVVTYGRPQAKGTLRVHSNQNSNAGLHVERTGLAGFPTWTQTNADTLTYEPNVHDAITVAIGGTQYCTGQGDCRVVVTYRTP